MQQCGAKGVSVSVCFALSYILSSSCCGSVQATADNDFPANVASADLLVSAFSSAKVSVDWQADEAKAIPGWAFACTHSLKDYDAGVDRTVGYKRKPSAYIKSVNPQPLEMCSLYQVIRADHYRGKQICFSGYIKTELVERGCGFCVRIDDPNGPGALMDNMRNRSIIGTSDWRKVEITLDVPLDATRILLGTWLEGKGRIWLNAFHFQVLKDSSAQWKKPMLRLEPLNLNFEPV